jgi:two-component system NtrC family sensor kinase
MRIYCTFLQSARKGVHQGTKIFDPFFTMKDSEEDSALIGIRKGSGLGLYVVEEIIEEHSVCIGVYSEVAEGTSFLIRLPMGRA